AAGRVGRVLTALPPAVAAGLGALVRGQGATVFMGLLAGLYALLGRFTGEEDLVVGTPVANRGRVEVEPLVGFFVNSLPLRGDLRDDPTFAALLSRARETTLGAYAHQDVPFAKLVAELKPERNAARTPLFQVVVALHNTPFERLDLPGLTLETLAAEEAGAKFDLTIGWVERDGGLAGAFDYDRSLFDEVTIRRLAAAGERLVAAAV